MRLGSYTEEEQLETARRQYEHGQADMGIEAGATALIVVDMMDEFVKPNWCNLWVPEATRQVPRIQQMIEAFRAAGLPVIYTAYEVGMKGKNFPTTEWLIPIITDGGLDEGVLQEVRIYEPLTPAESDYLVLKHCYSGFYGTELELVLRAEGVSTVVICGTMSEFCCSSTAREAFWRGFKVIFGSDVNSTHDPRQHEAECRTIRRGFGRIMSSDEIIAGVAVAHPESVGPAAA
jgi:nicotinamidase-related amidase